MKKIILIALLVLFAQGVFSQIDTVFWFVAPEVSSAHGDSPIWLRISTLNQPANVTVSMPANPGFAPISFAVAANAVFSLDLSPWKSIIENYPFNVVNTQGIKITATQFVSAYYEVETSCACNPEIFALKGKNALGLTFYTPFQLANSNGGYSSPQGVAISGIDIVATENNTNVTITPSTNAAGHPAGVPFTITLNQGETYSVVAAGSTGPDHMAGTHITSNKKIAVTLKDDSITMGGCADLVGDQIVPVDFIGTDYIIRKGFLNNDDWVYVLATQNGTQVSVNGTPVSTLNIGQTYTYSLNAATAFVQTSAPVYVWHVTGYGCELGAAILPSIECTGSTQVGFTRTTNQSFSLNLLVKNGGQGAFTVTGSPATIGAGAFTPVPGTGGVWMSAQVTFNTTQVPVGAGLIVSNPNKFHLGVINGNNTGGCRYGYFSDFSNYIVSITPDTTVCAGTNLQLTAASLSGLTYNWSGPSGFSSTNQNPMIPNITTAQSGLYTMAAFDADGCPSDTSRTQVTVLPTPAAPIVSYNLPTCQGDTLFLTSPTTAPSYNWTGPNGFVSVLQNPTILNMSPILHNGIYSLVFTDTNGCVSNPNTLNLTVTPYPSTPVITSNAPVCVGDTLQISTGTVIGGTYHWTGPNSLTSGLQNLTFLNSTNANAGAYSLTITHPNGCTSLPAFFNAIVNPLPPAPNASVNTPVCAGDNLLFASTTPAASYYWTGLNGFVSALQNPQIGGATAANAGNYQLIITDANGCVSPSTTLNAVVNPIPAAPSITTNSPICQGATLQMGTTLTGVTYNWSGPGGFVSALQNPAITNAQPSNSGAYSLSVTANTGCVSPVTSLNLTVNPLPLIFAGNDTVHCDKQGIMLQASGGVAYVWSPATAISNPNISNPIVNPNVATTYTVTGTDANGCVNIDNVAVDVLKIDAGAAHIICPTTTTALSANTTGGNPLTYAWSPTSTILSGVNTLSPTVLPIQTTIYTLTVTNSTGCQLTDTVSVKVRLFPPANAGADKQICIGKNTTLQASGGVSYSWSPASNLSNPLIINPIAAPTQTTDYMVAVTDVWGCQKTDTVKVVVNPLPTIVASTDQQICRGDSVQLSVSGGVTYNWYPGAYISDVSMANPMVFPPNTMLYKVQGRDINGCINRDSVRVEVIQLPVVKGIENHQICKGQSATLVVHAQTFNGGVPTFYWSNGMVGSAISVAPLDTQQYFVYATESLLGCKGDSFAVTVQVETRLPLAAASATPTAGVAILDVQFENLSQNASRYLWDFGDNTALSTEENPNHSYREKGEYDVRLIADNTIGCPDTVFYPMMIRVRSSDPYFPNGFSPNGDGINDGFFIPSDTLLAFHIDIFNRWGTLIFTSDDPHFVWDGNDRRSGQSVPEGVYVYKVTYVNLRKNKEVREGTITLFR